MIRSLLLPVLIVAATSPLVPPNAAIAGRPVLRPDDRPMLVSDDFELADGAAWDGAATLYVPDVKGRKLLAFNLRKPDQPPKTVLDSLAISGTCFQLGQLYLADNRDARILTFQPGGEIKTFAAFDSQERPNDLAVDAEGNVYTTLTRQGLVRKITPEGNQSIIANGLDSPNGIALSPSGKRLYVSSARLGVIFRIDLTGDQPSGDAAELFCQLPATTDGYKGDGMCVDRAGNLYVCGAQSVVVFDPSGDLISTLTTPQRPINVTIAGTQGRTLFVSTFGGLYQHDLSAYGVMPNRPTQPQNDDSPTSTAIPDGIRAEFNRVYAVDGKRELLMDLFVPQSNDAAKPAVIVVHGGGWINGDKTKFRALAIRLAERGYVTAAIEYRLAHEATFPAGVRDCNAATVYLRSQAKELGIDPKRIAAVGGSAGGHLVGLMAAGDDVPELKSPADRDADSSLAAAVVMAGPLEIATGPVAERSIHQRDQSNSNVWLDGNLTECPQLYHLADALEKIDASMPPTLFLCGSQDNPDRNEKARDKMNALNIPNQIVVHEGAKHGHWNRADWISQVVSDIDDFLKKHL
ncbi:SMP-30/gluconolactonase/LRE family protein [Roseiconus nitratireducens]|nr:SMP-30/gluconolactonase/LRE family protein [Roseiconus nitratireducens]